MVKLLPGLAFVLSGALVAAALFRRASVLAKLIAGATPPCTVNTYIGGWQGSDGICITSSTSKAYLRAGFDYPAHSPNPCCPINQFQFSSPAASLRPLSGDLRLENLAVHVLGVRVTKLG